MKKKFTIYTYWVASIDVTVEAETENEAMELAPDKVTKEQLLSSIQYDDCEIVDEENA